MTSGGGRRRGRGQRLLYFFRTPPGVRVGRAAIDEDAIRLIEEHNPDVQFDWTRILKTPQQPTQEQGRREGRDDRRRHEQPRSSVQPASSSQVPPGGFPAPADGLSRPASGDSDVAESGLGDHAEPVKAVEAVEALDPREPGELEEPEEPGGLSEPGEHEERERLETGGWEPEARSRQLTGRELEAESLEIDAEGREIEADSREIGAEGREIEADSREIDAESREIEADRRELGAGSGEPFGDVEPRYARIGAEGLARLRARYAEVMARISDKPLEEGAREELRNKAERLNPDSWVTEDEVAEALEQYETVFEELRAVVGRHPRRRRQRRL